MKSFLFIILGSGILCSILGSIGCYQAETSAAMVLDNASSVVRTGADKLWIEPEFPPTPMAGRY